MGLADQQQQFGFRLRQQRQQPLSKRDGLRVTLLDKAQLRQGLQGTLQQRIRQWLKAQHVLVGNDGRAVVLFQVVYVSKQIMRLRALIIAQFRTRKQCLQNGARRAVFPGFNLLLCPLQFLVHLLTHGHGRARLLRVTGASHGDARQQYCQQRRRRPC